MMGHPALRRIGAMLSGPVLRLLPFAVAAFVVAFVWAQISGYGASLVKNHDWVRRVEVPTLSELNDAVFRRLVDNGLVWAERRPGQVLLHHAPCTNVTRSAPEQVTLRKELPAKERGQMLDLLCLSPQGEFIQNEIEAWNLSYELLAIRDNRNFVGPVVNRPCEGRDATASARFFVPTHCYENRWSARYVSENAPPIEVKSNPNAVPPARDYAFLALERIAYPGDWRVLAPFGGDRVRGEAAKASGHYELSSDITLGSKPVTLQVVGTVTKVRVVTGDTAREWRIDEKGDAVADGTAGGEAPVQIESERVCDNTADQQNASDCETDPAKLEPFAYSIDLTSRAKQPASFRVELWVTPNQVPAVEFAEAEEGDESGPARAGRSIALARSTNIRARCCPPHLVGPSGAGTPPEGPCEPEWVTSKSSERRAGANGLVSLRDAKESLVDSAGVLTDTAIEADLAEIVGLGPATYGSLARSLIGIGKQTVQLTISQDYQKLAVRSLKDNIACDPKNRARRRNKNNPCKDASRGTLVVMDAETGSTGGEILALASWPGMEPGFGAWDLAALDAGQPSESPIAGNGWRAHDGSAMAGSTFKVVTALAAMQRVLDTRDETLRGILMGTSPIGKVEAALRIQRASQKDENGSCQPSQPNPPGTGNVLAPRNDSGGVGRCLTNSHTPSQKEVADAARFCQRTQSDRLGLCEALASSSNLYFGGLALYLDAPAFETTKERDALPQLALARMTHRLFPDKPSRCGKKTELAAEPRGGLVCKGATDSQTRTGETLAQKASPLLRLSSESPSRLAATPFELPAEAARTGRNSETRQLELAQNGFGQAVTATPVNIATVYASVGAGMLLHPTLTPRQRARADPDCDMSQGQSLLNVLAGREGEYDSMMAQVKLGLNGVIMVGTASKQDQFSRSGMPKELVERIFLKTGTATIVPGTGKRRAVYSAWLAGWIEPPPRGGGSGITRQIAIACQISRTTDAGAAACGPIVSAFIRGLHANRQAKP